MKRITCSKAALRTRVRTPINVSMLIRSKIEQYAADPQSLANDVRTLKGEPGMHGLRVGDWRVVFTEDRSVIAMARLAPRGNVYD